MMMRIKMMTKIQWTISYVDVDCLANGDVCNVSDDHNGENGFTDENIDLYDKNDISDDDGDDDGDDDDGDDDDRNDFDDIGDDSWPPQLFSAF